MTLLQPRMPQPRLSLSARPDRAGRGSKIAGSSNPGRNDQTTSELSRLIRAYAAAAMITRIMNGASFFMVKVPFEGSVSLHRSAGAAKLRPLSTISVKITQLAGQVRVGSYRYLSGDAPGEAPSFSVLVMPS